MISMSFKKVTETDNPKLEALPLLQPLSVTKFKKGPAQRGSSSDLKKIIKMWPLLWIATLTWWGGLSFQ